MHILILRRIEVAESLNAKVGQIISLSILLHNPLLIEDVMAFMIFSDSHHGAAGNP